jgi:hypothetical protein
MVFGLAFTAAACSSDPGAPSDPAPPSTPPPSVAVPAPVPGVVDPTALISILAARLIQIQHSDGGWDWSEPPAQQSSSTNAPSTGGNMSGVNAMGLVSAYTLSPNTVVLGAIQKTAAALMLKPISRTQRLYAEDCELLAHAAGLFSNPGFRARAVLGVQLEKEYLAAVQVYGTPAPSDFQVGTLTDDQIASVTTVQLVAANRARMTAAGRSAGLRAFDWGSRMRVAKLLGDEEYFNAMADTVARDFASIAPGDEWYVTGLSQTISDLALTADSAYAPTIQSARTRLAAQVGSNGWVIGGALENQAFAIQASLEAGDATLASRLVTGLQNRIGSQAYFVDDSGNETSEDEAEALRALVSFRQSVH